MTFSIFVMQLLIAVLGQVIATQILTWLLKYFDRKR